jgi:hypothetical protein
MINLSQAFKASDLKPGDSRTHEVDGQALVVEPIPYGNLKKLVRIIMEAQTKVDAERKKEGWQATVPVLVEQYADQVIPLLFPAKKHPFLTTEWLEDNLTIPLFIKILIDAAMVNGLGDFFLERLRAVESQQRPPQADPDSNAPANGPGNTTSTTSSDSPTDGVPATSTT